MRIVVLGDSLTAGYGLEPREAFPVQLERYLQGQNLQVNVINQGVSGDTSAGGLARLGWVLDEEPDMVIIELGANDALRGLSPSRMKASLEAIILRLKEENIRVLLAGMYAPGNMGETYARNFHLAFSDLAGKYEIPLYPFFLKGVSGKPGLNLEDGIHPNARGIKVIVENIGPMVEGMVREIRKAKDGQGQK